MLIVAAILFLRSLRIKYHGGLSSGLLLTSIKLSKSGIFDMLSQLMPTITIMQNISLLLNVSYSVKIYRDTSKPINMCL